MATDAQVLAAIKRHGSQRKAAAALRDMTIERAERDEGQGEAEPPRKDWTACNIQSGECE